MQFKFTQEDLKPLHLNVKFAQDIINMDKLLLDKYGAVSDLTASYTKKQTNNNFACLRHL